ncbi:hypothetical protein H5P28_06170 [Ruficoccus amylovorans]|uniref:Right handed beta helix domain-containing protein n=1 Tax=Ruficoccus amylovorans TaxID=1804625 RepID=A0A842HBP8_9BACT|nr:hypothetical protein [Ruficoccus amylovorans]MBC2593842.1 hypothetical protein [Ruficoccus amylovorans]
MIKTIVALSAFILAAPWGCLTAQAKAIYVLPEGEGARDGTNWQNALPGKGTALQEAWDTVSGGDSLMVGSGDYGRVELHIQAINGAEVRTLQGVDTGNGLPRFSGDFDKDKPGDGGGNFLIIEERASNLAIADLWVGKYQNGVLLRGRSNHLRFTGLEFHDMREGIRSDAGGTPEDPLGATHDVWVVDCRFVYFTKRAIRLEEGNYAWKIQGCYADAGGKVWATEPFQICFQIGNKSEIEGQPQERGITFIDCVALNCYNEGASHTWSQPIQERYWNGDGFSVEAKVAGMRYIRCISMHHTDGGWDDKSDGPVFIDCVAIDNKRNIRLWGQHQLAVFQNVLSAYPRLRGGNSVASVLWTRSNIEAENCKFVDSGPVFIDLDRETSPDAKLVFSKSLLICSRAVLSSLVEDGNLVLENSMVVENRVPEYTPKDHDD